MITWGWIPRAHPLEPVAAVGRGSVARELVRLVLERERLDLCVQVGPELALVWGPDLPWLDGLTYLGTCPEAPGVLLPTSTRPDLPVGLVGRALRRKHASGVLALLPQELLCLGPRQAADASRLRHWLEAS